ncbi:MAG: ATP-binding protein [Thermoleophilaceae bacterium]
MSAARFTERELEIDANFARMPDVRDFAEGAAAAAGFAEESRYAIKSAFGEAVANAIEHGSQPGDTIDLWATVEDDSLVLCVHDSGMFVPRVDPRGDLPERGRGLAFMNEMMDEVQVHPSRAGTLVRLAKKLPDG